MDANIESFVCLEALSAGEENAIGQKLEELFPLITERVGKGAGSCWDFDQEWKLGNFSDCQDQLLIFRFDKIIFVLYYVHNETARFWLQN